jgi:hypothetical protein
MIFWDGIACAVWILRRGQKKGEARSGDYGQALRRTHDAKSHGPLGFALAGAVRRAIDPPDRSLYRLTVAALDRCPRIALRAAPGGSPRQRETQTFLSQKIMLSAQPLVFAGRLSSGLSSASAP